MKSRTSFFNSAVLRKDLVRFSPVWVLYSIGMVMAAILMVRSEPEAGDLAQTVSHSVSMLAIPTMLYAGVCAMVLFGDLFVPRMCNALHAMPMRREGWFLTHTAAGLLFGLIPNVLGALILAPGLGEFRYVIWYWLAAAVGEFLFFYGLASLCAVCAGNRLGMAAIYAIANSFSGIVYAVIEMLYSPLLYGVQIPTDLARHLSPVVELSSFSLFQVWWNEGLTQQYVEYPDAFEWYYLLAVTVLGVVLAAAAMVVYRRRQLERAGDFLAVRPLEPVFLLSATLLSGILFYLFSELIGQKGTYPLLFAGMAVGWFVGKMLLERRVQVFRMRNVAGYVLTAAVVAGSLGLTWLDPMGLVEKIPAEDQIEFCTMDLPYRFYPRRITDPEEIHAVRLIHGELCRMDEQELRDKAGASLERITIAYQMTDGSRMKREYLMNSAEGAGREIAVYMSRWENLLQATSLEEFEDRVYSAVIFRSSQDPYGEPPVPISPEMLPRVLEAIAADCDEGHLLLDTFWHGSSSEAIQFEVARPKRDDGFDYDSTIYLPIQPDSVHTRSVLDEILAEHPDGT